MKKIVLGVFILLTLGVQGFAQNLKNASADSLEMWKRMTYDNDLRANAKLGVHYVLNGEYFSALKYFQVLEKAYDLGSYTYKLNISARNKSFLRDSALCMYAFYDLCMIYFADAGAPNTFKNYSKGVALVKQLAIDNFPNCQVLLGEIYGYGHYGVPIDKKEAYKWFMKAAEAGSAEGQYYMGAMYFVGDEIIPKSIEQARYWMKKSAENGLEEAAEFIRENGL